MEHGSRRPQDSTARDRRLRAAPGCSARLRVGGIAAVLIALTARVDAEPTSLARGVAWSVEGGAGVSRSAFSTALAIHELGALGGYIHRREDHAIALEAVESFEVVVDRTTPQYGFVGIALRHTARPAKPLLGVPGRTATFQRLAVGPAYLVDGHRFELGLGVHGSLAYLLWGSTGVSLDVSAQIYDVSQVSANTLVTLSVAFTLSPLVDVRPPAPQPWRLTTPRQLPGACEDSSVYQSELAAHRKMFVEVCPGDTEACEREHAAIDRLNAKLQACARGEHAP